MGRYDEGLKPMTASERKQHKRRLDYKHRAKNYEKNREKILESAKRWAKENPEKVKNIKIQYDHGITLEQYNQKFMDQGELCAICAVKLTLGQKAHLDHDHETRLLRDFLCWHCNRGLGCFKDSPQLLVKAVQYLQKHNKKELSENNSN